MYINQQEERELVKWWEDFESLWESSTDNNGDKNTFEFERLKDFIRNLIARERKEGYEDGRLFGQHEQMEGIPLGFVEDVKAQAIKSERERILGLVEEKKFKCGDKDFSREHLALQEIQKKG